MYYYVFLLTSVNGMHVYKCTPEDRNDICCNIVQTQGENVCVFVYMHVCVHVCMHVCMCVCTCACTCA